MAMMLSTVNPEAAAAIGNPRKVGIGTAVVYHARAGHMRDRRTSFPALVLRQNADDNSLDLFVVMEREDFAVEERVAFRSHNQPHHCWSDVEGADSAPQIISDWGPAVTALAEQSKLFEARIAALETKRGRGRPRKDGASPQQAQD